MNDPLDNPSDHTGRVVLVTGGTKGIGRHIAGRLRGRRRHGGGVRPHRARRRRRGRRRASPTFVACDVRDPDQVAGAGRRHRRAVRPPRRGGEQRGRRTVGRLGHGVAPVQRADHRPQPARPAHRGPGGQPGHAGPGRRRRDRQHRQRVGHPAVARHRRLRRGQGRACSTSPRRWRSSGRRAVRVNAVVAGPHRHRAGAPVLRRRGHPGRGGRHGADGPAGHARRRRRRLPVPVVAGRRRT